MTRKTLLFLLSSLFVLFAKAQTLTVLELLQLSNKPDWESVNSYLVAKGWEYYDSKEGDNESYNTVTWSYEKSYYNDKAQGWFHLYTYTGFPNKVSYQFLNKSTYNTIKNTLASNGFKYIDSDIKDEQVVSKYANPYFIILLSYIKSEKEEYSETSLTNYLVTVIKKAGVYDDDNGFKKSYGTYGNLESEYTLKDGKINGITKAYYTNGQVKVVSNFVSGTKQGASKEYDESGNLTAEYNYVNGAPNGTYKTYEEGKLKIMGTLLNGRKKGQFKVYDTDGNLDKEYVLNGDSLNGSYTEYYYKDKKLILKNSGQYLNDKKNGLWQFVKYKDKGTDLLSSHTYLNGEYNGEFKEVSGDSIIFGTYEKGQLNGKYKIYTTMLGFLLGEVTGDTSNAILLSSGNYYNGLKSGYWKNYSITNVMRSEGSYYNDEKAGEWKYYYDDMLKSDKTDEKEPYSKQLYLTENYENGRKNGKSVQTSYLEKTIIPCDTSKYKNKSPLDTCYSMVYHKVYQTAYFKNDEMHGPYEARDSAGITITKGTLINGEKDGMWLESYANDGSDGEYYYVFQRGKYLNGKRTGVWDEYIKEDFVFTKYSYVNGSLDGKTTAYYSQHKPKEEKYFDNGKLKTLITYDSLDAINCKYEILSETNFDLTCRRTDFDKNGKVSQIYWMKKDAEDLNHNFFELIFLIKTDGKLSDGTTGYANGEFKLYNSNDKILVEGNYLKTDKIGKWKIYYYDVSVYTEQDFTINVGDNEKYFIIGSDQPFSGKFILKYDNGKPKYEFKVSDGLREGKSKYFDESGKTIKTEKYEKGILK
ncbi:MAG: hypothetical protein IPP32_16385 [Bacteroidetes bacterium]|nr:hypothetical protein [Bacteroidota bacterium]